MEEPDRLRARGILRCAPAHEEEGPEADRGRPDRAHEEPGLVVEGAGDDVQDAHAVHGQRDVEQLSDASLLPEPRWVDGGDNNFLQSSTYSV